MRDPGILEKRRPRAGPRPRAPTRRQSGCRRYSICFSTARGNPASQSFGGPVGPKRYPRPYPGKTQRCVFARKRRDNEAIRSFHAWREPPRGNGASAVWPDELVRPPGIFASARRLRNPLASAALGRGRDACITPLPKGRRGNQVFLKTD